MSEPYEIILTGREAADLIIIQAKKLVDQAALIDKQKEILGKTVKFLNVCALGDQMSCLVCYQGNDGIARHKQECELKNLIDSIESFEKSDAKK